MHEHMEKNSVCIFSAVRETMKGEKQDVYTKRKIMIELSRPVEQKSITGKNIIKNLKLTSKEERYIFWPRDSNAERLKYEKHFQWYIKLKSTRSGVEYASWEKIVLKRRPCNVV